MLPQEVDCVGGVPLGNQENVNAPQGEPFHQVGDKLLTGCPQHMPQDPVQIRASEEGCVEMPNE